MCGLEQPASVAQWAKPTGISARWLAVTSESWVQTGPMAKESII